MQKTITVSAPGKLMLMGEHAVVYGHPCLVTAVGQRMKMELSKIDELEDRNIEGGNENSKYSITINAPDVKVDNYSKSLGQLGVGDIPKGARFIEIAVNNFRKKYPFEESLTFTTSSEFSSEFGFGSSSASTVCTVFGLSKILDIPLSNKELFDIAYQTVLDIQRKGSGFDIAAAIYGGTLYFETGGTSIEPLDLPPLPLIVGYSGVKGDTVKLLSHVSELRTSQPEKVERLFSSITQLVHQGKEALLSGDFRKLGTLFTFNQDYLRNLGVSIEQLDAMVDAAILGGAFGAKLSGAGGGDCMIALSDPIKRDTITQEITNVGGQVIEVETGVEGVRVEGDDMQELFVVVDENDNILGYKTRYECHHNKSLIHRVVGVNIFDSKGNVLLQKRSMTKDIGGGDWGTASAGHVMKNETYEQAALREMKEELGIIIPIIPVKKQLNREKTESEMAMIFKVIYDGPFHPYSKEISEVRFFSKDEITRGLLSGEFKMTEGAYSSLKTIGYL
jgi:mevalonate kinase